VVVSFTSQPFTKEITPGIYHIVGSVGHRAGLDVVVKRNISALVRNQNSGHSAHNLVTKLLSYPDSRFHKWWTMCVIRQEPGLNSGIKLCTQCNKRRSRLSTVDSLDISVGNLNPVLWQNKYDYSKVRSPFLTHTHGLKLNVESCSHLYVVWISDIMNLRSKNLPSSYVMPCIPWTLHLLH
jgi:hypothetical protein